VLHLTVNREDRVGLKPETQDALELVALATALADCMKRCGMTREQATERAGAVVNAAWSD
jgi:hypothetical protein